MRNKRIIIGLSIALVLALGLALAATAEVEKPAVGIDKKLCSEKLRFGQEAFARAKYQDAKAYFKEAVQADPSSARAWAFYDLSTFYALAEQVKNTGTVRSSSAPEPGSYNLPPASGAPAPTQTPQAQAPPQAPAAPPATAPGIPVIPKDEGC